MAVDSKASGIVLYAKKRGPTSFNSLNHIKKALNTKKVGHTGTLDSFAEGLLVVMVGSLTRLASHVTAFDKKYEAIIAFGKETDTLDPFGNVTETKELPKIEEFRKSVEKYTGTIEQYPPQYSAIHINGKRASDIARTGKKVDMPSRNVCVYSATIHDVLEIEGRIAYAKVSFHVSKGTYIRSLARDIAKDCASCAHLIALRRTAVGSFGLHKAVGYDDLQDFSIDTAIKQLDNKTKNQDECDYTNEIKKSLYFMTESLAKECGMNVAYLLQEHSFSFYNGKPLKSSMFAKLEHETNKSIAVFDANKFFIGVIEYRDNKLSYGYVIPQT